MKNQSLLHEQLRGAILDLGTGGREFDGGVADYPGLGSDWETGFGERAASAGMIPAMGFKDETYG